MSLSHTSHPSNTALGHLTIPRTYRALKYQSDMSKHEFDYAYPNHYFGSRIIDKHHMMPNSAKKIVSVHKQKMVDLNFILRMLHYHESEKSKMYKRYRELYESLTPDLHMVHLSWMSLTINDFGAVFSDSAPHECKLIPNDITEIMHYAQHNDVITKLVSYTVRVAKHTRLEWVYLSLLKDYISSFNATSCLSSNGYCFIRTPFYVVPLKPLSMRRLYFKLEDYEELYIDVSEADRVLQAQHMFKEWQPPRKAPK